MRTPLPNSIEIAHIRQRAQIISIMHDKPAYIYRRLTDGKIIILLRQAEWDLLDDAPI